MEKIERAHETLRSLSVLMAIEAFRCPAGGN